MKKNSNKQIQEQWAKYWDNVWVQKDRSKKLKSINKKEQIYFSLAGIINSYIKDYTRNDKEYRIIEIGCGGSSIFPILIKSFKNLKIAGIDRSLFGCNFVFEGNEYRNGSVDVICGDALQIPIKNNSFDISYSIGLVEHFENQYEIIKSHVDLLKKEGLVVIVIPNLTGFQKKLLRSELFKSKTALNNENWVNGMKITTPEKLKKILKKLGCKKIEIKPAGGLHPLLMLESYYSEEYSEANKFSDTIYKIFLSGLFILINIPFIFRLNLMNLSPFIVATAIKK
jgi:SAM-dependent methyltransferase